MLIAAHDVQVDHRNTFTLSSSARTARGPKYQPGNFAIGAAGAEGTACATSADLQAHVAAPPEWPYFTASRGGRAAALDRARAIFSAQDQCASEERWKSRRRYKARFRPDKLHGDKAYDSRKSRALCRARRIVPRIARRGIESPERLGRYRWVVERTFAWVHRFRRLLIRYERRSDIHRGFLTLAAIAVCCRFLGIDVSF